MENPEEDITRVIYQLTATASPDLQRAAVERYMTPDVSFWHPVCYVRSGPSSRDQVLGIYQWYRVLSPRIDIKVQSIVFDRSRSIVYAEIVQWFRLFFLPIKPVPARLITRLQLQKKDDLYYISQQEDFYHTTDFAALLFPPIAPLVGLWLVLAGFISRFLANVAQVLGYWRPGSASTMSGQDSDLPGDREDLYEEDTEK